MELKIVQYNGKDPLDLIQCEKCKEVYSYRDYKILAENYKLLLVEAPKGYKVCNLCLMEFIKNFLKERKRDKLSVSFKDEERDTVFVFKSKDL